VVKVAPIVNTVLTMGATLPSLRGCHFPV